MTVIKYPQLKMQLLGEDGNAFSIMGRLTNVLRRGGVPKEEIDAIIEDMMSSDYDHLLHVAMTTVECDSE